MIIKSYLKNYCVMIENDESFVMDLFGHSDAVFVIDRNVFDLYYDTFKEVNKKALFLLEAIEEKKVIDTALDICELITQMPAKRNVTLISIGGGIVQDITGFVANVTYRGIRWIYVPTTLLASCDSCIGSKTSLNYKRYKNMLGTFYPPDEIHIWPGFFSTLPDRDYKSGLGEIVKFNIMMGKRGLINMEADLPTLLTKNMKVVDKYVQMSLEYKKAFIEQDEFDNGERIKLNFAHTFGHAIEVISNYQIPHGTAVAAGMIMADKIACDRGHLPDDIRERWERILLKIIDIDISLLERPIEEYVSVIRKDKKQMSDELSAVIITDYGDNAQLTVIHDMRKSEVDVAIHYFIDLYRRAK